VPRLFTHNNGQFAPAAFLFLRLPAGSRILLLAFFAELLFFTSSCAVVTVLQTHLFRRRARAAYAAFLFFDAAALPYCRKTVGDFLSAFREARASLAHANADDFLFLSFHLFRTHFLHFRTSAIKLLYHLHILPLNVVFAPELVEQLYIRKAEPRLLKR
jgi:hypothetical protein